MRQKTTITYLEHNMLAYNRINRAIASWKKHVRVFSETCTSFSENTYMFFRKDVGVSSASLKAYNKCMLVSLLASFFAVSTVNAQVNERGDSVIVIKAGKRLLYYRIPKTFSGRYDYRTGRQALGRRYGDVHG